MMYKEQELSIESIEFDDEREIMSYIFDHQTSDDCSEDVDYLNPSLTQNSHMLHAMPEVCRVARILLGEAQL
jgi:hypothetical protein